MHITSKHRLEVLFKRTPYADTFRYIQNFKPKQIRFQDIFYNLDNILHSHNCCEWTVYIRDFNNENIAFFDLPMFLPQVTHKLSELFHTDIVYTINLDVIPASYNIKNFLGWMNNTNKSQKKELTKCNHITTNYLST